MNTLLSDEGGVFLFRTKRGDGMENSLLKVSKDGLYITLMDGSRWRLLNGGDKRKTLLWYSLQRIFIEADNEYTLTNLETYAPDRVRVLRVV